MWKAAAMLAAAALLTRLPSLWIHVLDVDEAIWAVAARAWLAGGVPYIDFADNKPLGIMAMMAAIFRIGDNGSLVWVHAFTIAWVAATGMAVLKLVEPLAGRRAGLAAGLLYVVFSANYIPKVISTNIETIINLPLAMSAIALMRAWRSRPIANLFLAGTMVGIACCFKYQAGIMALYIPAALIAMPPGGFSSRARGTLAGIASFSAGAAWPFALMIAYLYSQGSLPAFADATLGGSMSYIAKGSELAGLATRIAVRLGSFVAASSPLWFFAVKRAIRLRRSLLRMPGEIFLLGWLCVTTVAVVTGWRLYGHYFLLWLPPLAALAGMEIRLSFAEWSGSRRGLACKAAAVASIAVITIGLAVPRYMIEKVNGATGEDNPSDYLPIAMEVANRTSPAERIFAWGYAPCIYYFSDRLPSYRYQWSDRLTGRHSRPGKVAAIDLSDPAIVREWRDWSADMEKNRPAYIIDTSPAKLHDAEHYPVSNYPMLKALLESGYEIEDNVAGADLYRKRY
ncbi:MAG: glycosyltransferase family 39 protein [Proteobacteria bacterium]|nr:glycosyltransferase family 39 protein [Pseudomonadota bacterium]